MSCSVLKIYLSLGVFLILGVATHVCLAQGVTMKGRVQTEPGQTPPHPKVVLIGKGVRREANVDRGTGEFRIERVQQGIFSVAACAGTNYVPQIQENVEVKDGKSPWIELTLPYAGNRQPMFGPFKNGKGIEVLALAYGCEVARTRVNEQGRYEFKELPRPPKEYRIAALDKEGRLLASGPIPLIDKVAAVALKLILDSHGLAVGLEAELPFPVPIIDPTIRTRGQLAGRISDSSGSAAPGVRVTIINQDTGQARTVITDPQGDYRVAEVDPGNYQIEIAGTGFKVYKQEDVLVTANQDMSLNAVLEVGEVSSTVTVSEGEPAPTSIDSSVKIMQLPLSGRDVVNLLTLQPGVSPSSSAAISGQRSHATNIILDGVDTNDNLASSSTPPVSLSSVGEFRFSQTGFQNVQLSKSASDQVDISTRTGTNTFHGEADYQIMNDALDARSFFNLPGFETFHRQSFSAKLGGPIKKDKLFFFVNYDFDRKVEAPNFSTVLSSRIGALNQQLRRLGLPAEDLRRFVTASASDSPLVRLDYNISRQHSASMIYSLRRTLVRKDLTAAPGGTSSAPSTARDISDRNRLLSLRYFWTIAPHLSSESSYMYRSNSISLVPVEPNEPSILIPGLALLGRATSLIDGDGRRSATHMISERLTIYSGIHRMDVGGYFDITRNRFQFAAFEAGRVIVPSLAALSSNVPTVDLFQLGRGGSEVSFDWSRIVVYFQDNIHVRSNYSVNLSLRYKAELPPSPQPRDPRGWQPNVGFAWTVSGNPETTLRAGYTLYRSFLPQLPLGFQLLMGGQGLQAIAPARRITSIAGPAAASSAFNQFLTGSIPAGPQMATTFRPDSHSPLVHSVDVSFSPSLGRRMALDVAYSYRRGANLVTSTNINLPPPVLINGRLDFRNASFNPGFTQIYQFETTGQSRYHAGSITVFRHFGSGLGFNAGYTFSKATDNVPLLVSLDAIPSGSFEATPENVFARGNEQAISSWNPNHKVNAWALWEVPKADRRKAGPFRRALGTLFFSEGLVVESGRHLNVLVGADANRDGNPLTDRPLTVARNTFLGQGRIQLDVRVGSSIQLTESQRLRLSVQIFNVFNRTNFANYNTVVGQPDLSGLDPNIVYGRGRLPGFDFRRPLTSSGFGLGTSTFGPRRVQLEVSYQF